MSRCGRFNPACSKLQPGYIFELQAGERVYLLAHASHLYSNAITWKCLNARREVDDFSQVTIIVVS